MKSKHIIHFGQSQNMSMVEDNSVDLIVTSPPYPMIEMWDDIMSRQNPQITTALTENNPSLAFELMHTELDKVWQECYRALKNGGFLCINIGDATRTINGNFALYNNHSRITNFCSSIGFTNLTNIIWRKQTNSPNKFMGSGMLPCGAYVTLEHEYILIFRKGGKRDYKNNEAKQIRRESSFFWEERNVWFSDLWDLKGTKQKLSKVITRERSAAFPLEVPYRLINMYSQKGDIVLDPFMGIGTTAQAAMLLGRDSIGYEIDEMFSTHIQENIASLSISEMNKMIKARYDKHIAFVNERTISNGALKHKNPYLSCDVMTSQEKDIRFNYLTAISKLETSPLAYDVNYEDLSDITKLPTLGTLF